MKRNQLEYSRNELQKQFLHWAGIRKRTRALLTELKTQFSTSTERRPREREARWRGLQNHIPPSAKFGLVAGLVAAPFTGGMSLAAPLASVGIAASSAFSGLVTGVIAGAVANALDRVRAPSDSDSDSDSVAGEEETAVGTLNRSRINEVHQAVDVDRSECQKLTTKEDVLGKCVADFAVFCREHIDSVLASRLVEDKFGFLLDILRGTRSHGAAQPRPTLLPEDVNVHFERVSNFLEQLQHSTSNNEDSRITQQILDELQESPTDQEIQTRIMNFMETQFAKACASQL